MVKEYGHLFFYEDNCVDPCEKERVSERKRYLLKELKASDYNVGALLEELKIQKAFMKEYETVILFMDGGVRNNHDNSQESAAASSFVVYGDKRMLTHSSQYIGSHIALPNQEVVEVNSTLAEYHGLLQALTFMEKHAIQSKKIILVTDCSSMVQHITEKLPQHPTFHEYAVLLRNKLQSFKNAELRHIPRTHNKVADKLVNQLLDIHERSEKYVISK